MSDKHETHSKQIHESLERNTAGTRSRIANNTFVYFKEIFYYCIIISNRETLLTIVIIMITLFIIRNDNIILLCKKCKDFADSALEVGGQIVS